MQLHSTTAPYNHAAPLYGDLDTKDEVLREELEQESLEEDEASEPPAYYDDSALSSASEAMTWITWFCSGIGHEYFAEVPEEFIEDDFNLTGLSSLVPYYKEALEMILDIEPDEADSNLPDISMVEASAELLYGLIHQRYIIGRHGLQQMSEKFEEGAFGLCPRHLCNGQPVVPCGRTDAVNADTVKLFCPSCLDIYVPPNSRFQKIDGAFFGTTFPHLFFQTYPDYVPAMTSETSQIYIPKIYGFRVSERAKTGPRMQWLRMRPSDVGELEDYDGALEAAEREERDRDDAGKGARGYEERRERDVAGEDEMDDGQFRNGLTRAAVAGGSPASGSGSKSRSWFAGLSLKATQLRVGA
ncbi:casein kinase 2 regulatory subunit [Saitoella coloradoensis]